MLFKLMTDGSFIYARKKVWGSLDFKTFICDYHKPHFIYLVNSVAVGSFDLDLVPMQKYMEQPSTIALHKVSHIYPFAKVKVTLGKSIISN
jgi:hypothetical protein